MTASDINKDPSGHVISSGLVLYRGVACLTVPLFYLFFYSLSVHQAELQLQEELLYRERKERERIIASYRKKVEERKAQAEKVDRRVRHIG